MSQTEKLHFAISKREFEANFHAMVREDGLRAHAIDSDNPWYGTCANGAFRMYKQEPKLSGSFPMVAKGTVETKKGGVELDIEYRQLPVRTAAPVIILLLWAYVFISAGVWLAPVAGAVTVMLLIFAILINPKKRRQELRQKLHELCGEEITN